MNPNLYSAVYFNRAETVLAHRVGPTPVTMQVFQKNDAVLCGINEVVAGLKAELDDTVEIWALGDGMNIRPWEPVMILKGNLLDFVAFESIYLGILARATKVATNARRVVNAANGKPVLFFADRFDRFENQEADGYAATIGGVSEVCTKAMARGAMRAKQHPVNPVGTMPHALIAAFGGDVVRASAAFLQSYPDVPLTALVDFNNDCVTDSLRCLEAFGKDLHAVRLDTSEKLVDETLREKYTRSGYIVDNVPWMRGVNALLVNEVRDALDSAGGEHVKICVSGGFSAEKITAFEADSVPVDIYAVGSSLLKGSNDFTADVVEPVAKVGRELQNTTRLTRRN